MVLVVVLIVVVVVIIIQLSNCDNDQKIPENFPFANKIN